MVRADCIDVIQEKSDYFRGYQKDVDRKLRDNFGIQDSLNWKNYCGTVSTILTEVICKVNYGNDSEMLEKFLLD